MPVLGSRTSTQATPSASVADASRSCRNRGLASSIRGASLQVPFAFEQHIVALEWKGGRHTRARSFIAAVACGSRAPSSRAAPPRGRTWSSCRTRRRSAIHAPARVRTWAARRRQVLATTVTLALLGPAGDRLKAHALPARLRPPVQPRRSAPRDVPVGVHARRGVAAVRAGRAGGSSTQGRSGRRGRTCARRTRCASTRPSPARRCLSGARPGAGRGGARRARRARPRGGAGRADRSGRPIALDVGAALAGDRIGLAAHRAIVQAAIAYRDAGLPAPPLQRFAGKIGAGRGAAVAGVGARAAAAGRRARAGHHPRVGRAPESRRPQRPIAASARVAVPDRGRLRRPGPLHRGERRVRGRAGQRARR